MRIALLCSLENLSARNLPPLYLPESTGESWTCPWSPFGRNKAGNPAIWQNSNGWPGGTGARRGGSLDKLLSALAKGAEASCQARAGGLVASLERQKLLFFIA